MKQVLSSQASHELRHNDITALLGDVPDIKVPCPYFLDCKVRDLSKKDCSKAITSCQTYKFYEKYKDFENGKYLGV
jgi:hypothetical protein